MPNKEHTERYAKLGYALFQRTLGAIAAGYTDEWCDIIMEEAEHNGLAETVPYDPKIHGDAVRATPGEPIVFVTPYVDESMLIKHPEPELPPLVLTNESATAISEAARKYEEIQKIASELALIGDTLRTQNNRRTQHPMFCVKVLRRIGPVDGDVFSVEDQRGYIDYPGMTEYYHDRPDPEHWKELDKLADDELPEGISGFSYYEEWEIKAVSFTEKGAQGYLNANGHNLRQYFGTEIYVESFNRNDEMIRIREALIRLSELISGPNPKTP